MHKVNWLAIIVADIVFFLFGGLWYDVLLKNAYVSAVGASQSPSGMTWYPFVISLVAGFFMAYGVARMLSWRQEMSAGRGAFIGFSMGLLIFGAATWMDYAFGNVGAILGWINIGYVAIGMGIQGLILGAWQPKQA